MLMGMFREMFVVEGERMAGDEWRMVRAGRI